MTPSIIIRPSQWICQPCLAELVARNLWRQGVRQTSSRRAFAASTRRAKDIRRDGKLPDRPARTRFAPSPTGFMHIGGLRTALFSYLLAKRTQGQFILRIEDTDQKRLVPGAVDKLCEDLEWAGLQWDEGPKVGGPYGPYQQSERNDLYQHHARSLLDEEAAYRCFCTPQTAGAGSAAFVTSGCYQDCSHISSPESQERATSGVHYTVRLKQPANVYKRTYPDLIYGNIKRLKRSSSASSAGDEDTGLDAADTILMKSDGTPTYHFANVVDDHLMKITHVIRGTEWMASTPLHYDLYTAFGWEPPTFAHVGLLLDKDKAKLSKRNADLALDVRGLRDHHGVLPETLCNFLALQGWSNPNKNDVMTIPELIDNFDLKFTRGNTMVLMEKMWFLQKNHVQRKCEQARKGKKAAIKDLVTQISEVAKKRYPAFAAQRDITTYCRNILLADEKSYQNPEHFVTRNWYFFDFDPSETPEPQELYASIKHEDVRALVEKVMSSMDSERPYLNPAAPKRIEDYTAADDAHARPPTDLERVSARVHAYTNEAVWKSIFGTSNPACTTLIPFADQPFDVTALANLFAKRMGGEATGDQLVTSYKEWQKAIMRYLRERLARGTPGPGVGMLMAVLGYEECCRRLGIDAEGNGW